MSHSILVISATNHIGYRFYRVFRIGNRDCLAGITKHGNIIFRIAKSHDIFGRQSQQFAIHVGGIGAMSAAQMATTPAGDDALQGIITLAAWPAALLLAAWVALRTRDA